nr:MAG TPA: hypothetical protein [Caudoviricetes sp.]
MIILLPVKIQSLEIILFNLILYVILINGI